MNAEIETYSTYLRGRIEDIQGALRGLTEAQLNARPPLEGANSLYVIAAHVYGNMRSFVVGIACGNDLRRDRPGEFASSGSYVELEKAASGLSQEIEAALAALAPESLDRRQLPAQELWGEGEAKEISGRGALVHALEHASIHLGQIQLTRDLLLSEARS